MISMNIFEFDHMCKKYLPVSMLPTAIELMPRFGYHCGPGIKRNRERTPILRLHDFAK